MQQCHWNWIFKLESQNPCYKKGLFVNSSQQQFFPLQRPLTRPCNNQFQSEATVVIITLTWAWWSWLSREHVSLNFLVSFTLRQPAVAWKDGTVPISRGYFHLLHKDALSISFAVMANAKSFNLEVGNISLCHIKVLWQATWKHVTDTWLQFNLQVGSRIWAGGASWMPQKTLTCDQASLCFRGGKVRVPSRREKKNWDTWSQVKKTHVQDY